MCPLDVKLCGRPKHNHSKIGTSKSQPVGTYEIWARPIHLDFPIQLCNWVCDDDNSLRCDDDNSLMCDDTISTGVMIPSIYRCDDAIRTGVMMPILYMSDDAITPLSLDLALFHLKMAYFGVILTCALFAAAAGLYLPPQYQPSTYVKNVYPSASYTSKPTYPSQYPTKYNPTPSVYVPSSYPTKYNPTPSVYVPPSYNPTPSVYVPSSYNPTPSAYVPPSYNPTPSAYVPPRYNPTPSAYVPPSYNPTPSAYVPPSYNPTPSAYVSDDQSDLGVYPCNSYLVGKAYKVIGTCGDYFVCQYVDNDYQSLYQQCDNYYSFDAQSGKCVSDRSCVIEVQPKNDNPSVPVYPPKNDYPSVPVYQPKYDYPSVPVYQPKNNYPVDTYAGQYDNQAPVPGVYPCNSYLVGQTYAVIGTCGDYFVCQYADNVYQSLYQQCDNYYSFDAKSGKCVSDNSCVVVPPVVSPPSDNPKYSNKKYNY
ncbi:hypothetical protein Btru_009094 [Bulinus truncatus]|nr:hypothetical protein Btru_009094 [Bulinus truncatus]